MEWKNRWPGATVVCMASGPSLIQEDIDAAFEWRNADRASRKIFVTNTTFRKALDADVLMAHDYKWWSKYINEVRTTFKGERVSVTASKEGWGIKQFDRKELEPYGNSGAGAVSLAILTGCKKVILLGYDCCHGPNGEVHHHGDHPRDLGNAFSLPNWPRRFEKLAAYASEREVEVINCSRRTALKCFKQGALGDVLYS